MVQAYILIQTEVGRASSVAQSIAALEGVAMAEDVTGPYDIIVRAEAPTMDELGRGILAQIQGIARSTRMRSAKAPV